MELLKMPMKRYPLFGKVISPKPQLSTIWEWNEEEPCNIGAFHGASHAEKEQTCSNINARKPCSEKLQLKLNHARIRAGFQVNFTKAHSPKLLPPLIGTPWNVAEFYSATTAISSPSFKGRRDIFLRLQRSKDEQDCIESWLTFFG